MMKNLINAVKGNMWEEIMVAFLKGENTDPAVFGLIANTLEVNNYHNELVYLYENYR